jgi:hypothetical protein
MFRVVLKASICRLGLPFFPSNVYIACNSLIGRKAGCFTTYYKSYVADGGNMDQVVEQVLENKEEVVELSLGELAQVGGGLGVDNFG